MSNFPMDTPGAWGEECWVTPPDPVPETCVAPTDLDVILEMPFQDQFTVPAGGVERFQDMITQLPAPTPESTARLDELLMTPPSGFPWGELMTWWLIGSATLTTVAAVAAAIYLTVHHRRASAPSVEVSS